MGWKNWAETAADVGTLGFYSLGKEEAGGTSGSKIAGANPIVGMRRNQRKAGQLRQEGMDRAISEQDLLREEMEARRAEDLKNTMAFYGPAMSALEEMYGIPASAWGAGAPGGAPPPPPPQTGMLPGGRPVTQMPFKSPAIANAARPMGGGTSSLPPGVRLAAAKPGLNRRRFG